MNRDLLLQAFTLSGNRVAAEQLAHNISFGAAMIAALCSPVSTWNAAAASS